MKCQEGEGKDEVSKLEHEDRIAPERCLGLFDMKRA